MTKAEMVAKTLKETGHTLVNMTPEQYAKRHTKDQVIDFCNRMRAHKVVGFVPPALNN